MIRRDATDIAATAPFGPITGAATELMPMPQRSAYE
jgi:hypothetical protein